MTRWLGALCLFWINVGGAFTLEITQGMQSATPIAVAEFHSAQALPEDMGEIIRHNLRNSGRFSPIEVGALPERSPRVGTVDVLPWLHLGAEDIVVGQIERTGTDQYRIEFELLDVYEPPNAEPDVPPKNHVLLRQRFDNIPATRLRALSHHISDLIFERLTGIRGAFATRIAYILVSERNQKPFFRLEVADADGHNAKTLFTSPEPVMSPAWSPDGRHLAFVSFEHFRAEVYVVDTVTGRRDRVSHARGINGAPAFSPDGSQLALVLSKEGSPKIYLLDLRSHILRRVTSGNAIDTEPNWAPDGQSLLFTSNRGGKPQLYRLWLAGERIERITYDGDYNARGSFTPDGKSVIMVHREGGDRFQIAKLNLNTQQLTLLSNAYLDQSPSISPNGTMILYATQLEGKRILSAVSLDGRVKWRLPAGDGNVQEPAWSPY